MDEREEKKEGARSGKSQRRTTRSSISPDLIIPPRPAFVNSTIIINDDVREGRGLALALSLLPPVSLLRRRECKLITPRVFREKHIKRPTLLRRDITV